VPSTNVSVIQQFLHPPVGLTALEALSGNPYSGLVALDRVRGPVRVDAFGIRWLITGYPDGYGVTPRAGNNAFDRNVIEIAIVHQTLDSNLVVSEQVQSYFAAGTLMFEESFPYVVDVELAPGIEANLYWVLIL
jgi:hypothetical protein